MKRGCLGFVKVFRVLKVFKALNNRTTEKLNNVKEYEGE